MKARVRQGKSYWLAFCVFDEKNGIATSFIETGVSHVRVVSIANGIVRYSINTGQHSGMDFTDILLSFEQVAKDTRRKAVARIPKMMERYSISTQGAPQGWVTALAKS
jgi:hypothetical protein